MNKSRQPYMFALLAVFFWSTIPTAFKICLGELGIVPMLTLASVTSALALFAILVSEGKTELIAESTRKELLNSAFLGFINPFIYYLVLLKAYSLLPAQVAQPLNMIWPIILVFLSVPLLGQKIRKKSFIALLISFTGVYIISSQGNLFHPGRSDLKGILLASGSSVFWALYFIFNVKDRREEAVKLFLNFAFGSLYLIILLIVTEYPLAGKYGPKGIVSALYIGLFEMGITFYLWLRALKTAETIAGISNLVYLAPFLSLVFVHFVLHEPLYYTTPAGLLFIISGIWYQNRKSSGI
ncbi:MAG: DMT family transporter [Bacteroidales bacterium]|nr:DMT family transporter [Bacteroidales bacterium]